MSASSCFDTARSTIVSSQACPDNLFNSFDLSEETFSSIFQNVQPCQYLNSSCLPIHCNNIKLILLHLNMKSLEKNYDNLDAFLFDLLCKPHIISISKTKIKDKPLVSTSLPGYIFLHKNSVSNAVGVGVYISDLLQFNEITFKATFSCCESLRINFNSSNQESSYVIGTVYRHPRTNITNFCEYLNEIFVELNMQMRHYFVLGGININTNTTNLNSSNFINMLSSNQFLPQLYTVTENNFDNKFEKFYSIIKLTIKNHAPSKILSIKQRRLKKQTFEN